MMPSTTDSIVLVYDTDLKAPACALIQAAYGCSSRQLHRFFEPKHWLVAPTPGMRKLAATDEQWYKAAVITERRWGDESPR
jgi:hypothetical protein